MSATFTDSGGAVTVTCLGTAISLTTAAPFNGYSLDVQDSGPAEVVVAFTGHGHTHTIRARCSTDGQPVRGGR